MDVRKPYAAIAPGAHGDVLAALSSTIEPRSGREIAKRAGRSSSGVQPILDRLVDAGLVERNRGGDAYLYAFNRDHILFPVVESMVSARSELVRALRRMIGDWEIPPIHASLFGSVARGDGDEDSDVDLFVVRPAGTNSDDPAWNGQLNVLDALVFRWTGNKAAVSEVGEQELHRLRNDRPPIVRALANESILIAGEPSKRLFGRGSRESDG